MQAHHPSTQDAAAGRLPSIPGQPGLQRKTLTQKNENKTKQPQQDKKEWGETVKGRGGTPGSWTPGKDTPRRGLGQGLRLTLGLQVLQEWLCMIQGAGGHTTDTVLSEATGGAQERVPVLGRIVSTRHGRACGLDQGQGHHTLHHVLQGNSGIRAWPHPTPPGQAAGQKAGCPANGYTRQQAHRATGQRLVLRMRTPVRESRRDT